jgi:nucleolar protein 56
MRRKLSVLLPQQLNFLSVSTSQAQTGITDLARFQRVVKMTAFHPFETAENALENINAITEHEMTEDLRTFLESNLAKGKKASKYPLGVVSDVIKFKPTH